MQRQCLIVDDEPAVCEMLGKILTSSGMEALKLTRSAEVPELLVERKFDMAFLGLHMPAPGGIELARQMRLSEWHRTTPIILISDDQRPSAMSIGFSAGATCFLYKPIDKDRLLKLIRATQGAPECGTRRTRRVALQSKARLRQGAEELECETVNVSPSGILVKAGRTLPMGSSVHVSLDLAPQMKPVVGRGSIVRVSGGHQMGIQLDRLAIAESERLQEFLLFLIPND